MLTAAQLRDSRSTPRVARQVIAAQPLQRTDGTTAQRAQTIGAGIRGWAPFAARRLPIPDELLDLGQRWRMIGKLGQELFQRWCLALGFDEDGAQLVLDETAEVQPGRQIVDEGPESDSLDDAANRDRATFHN